MPAHGEQPTLTTLIVDDEPLAIERLQVICSRIPALRIVGTAADGAAALRMIEALSPDLVLLDMTMPEVDGLAVAKAITARLPDRAARPAVIFVTAHDSFAVDAFDLEAVDYVLKPVAPERLARAIERALERKATPAEKNATPWVEEFWVPHRSELMRIAASDIHRIDAERDYVRLHVGTTSHLLLETISGLEKRLNPDRFIRIHRSTILRRDAIVGLRHDGIATRCHSRPSPRRPGRVDGGTGRR